MLDVLDEYTRESLATRVRRKLPGSGRRYPVLRGGIAPPSRLGDRRFGVGPDFAAGFESPDGAGVEAVRQAGASRRSAADPFASNKIV